jgi:hypothetical protein
MLGERDGTPAALPRRGQDQRERRSLRVQHRNEGVEHREERAQHRNEGVEHREERAQHRNERVERRE